MDGSEESSLSQTAIHPRKSQRKSRFFILFMSKEMIKRRRFYGLVLFLKQLMYIAMPAEFKSCVIRFDKHKYNPNNPNNPLNPVKLNCVLFVVKKKHYFCKYKKQKMNVLRFIFVIVVFVILQTPCSAQKLLTLTGTVVDEVNGEPLVGVAVYLPLLKKGAHTDEVGKYKIDNLPEISTNIQLSYMGHQTITEIIDLKKSRHFDFRMKEENAMLEEVVITGINGNTLIKHTPAPVTVVTNQTLLQTSSTNIIDAIAKQPGISQITTGSGISKPVIRGLGYNRVAVVNNGIRQEGQQWGDEHGVEIDANSVNKVQILKGPASLIYGSDALAGVIVMQSTPDTPDGTVSAGINAEYQTNNGLYNYSVNIDGSNNGFIWGGRSSSKTAHDYKNKYDGRVFNSRFSERAADATLGLNKHWGHSHLHLSYYNMTPGIVEGERDETTGHFIMPVDNGGTEDEAVYTDSRSYKKAVPYQQVFHYKAVSDNTFFIGNGQLVANMGFQRNIRKEYEDVLKPDDPELHFVLNTFSYDLHYLTANMMGWVVATGLNGMVQSSGNKGDEFLVPDYNSTDIGVFATANRHFDNLSVSAGLRFDNRHVHGKELMEDGDIRFKDFKRDFSGITGSIGATYNINDKTNVKLNVSRGFRAPNISELGSNGVHEGTFRYEVGNNRLKAEKSLQMDLGADYSSKWVSVQLALFANWIGDYIFLHKRQDDLGNEILVDDVPVYGFDSGNAWVYGGELTLDVHPWEPLHVENAFAYVDTRKAHSGHDDRYLPFTPAPRWNVNLRYEFLRHGKTFCNAFVSFEADTYFRQTHVFSAYDTETETPPYTLLNISAGTDLKRKGRKVASILFACNNLTDCAYQSHLSRLKYADINLVTGRRGIYNMGRNFIMKLNVPLML